MPIQQRGRTAPEACLIHSDIKDPALAWSLRFAYLPFYLTFKSHGSEVLYCGS